MDTITEQKDNVGHNPVTIIKWKLKLENNDFESKVSMNLYHTNQGVHLQGGRRHGQMTSCTMMASLFEDLCKHLIIAQAKRIQNIKIALNSIDLRKKAANQLNPSKPVKKNKTSKPEKEKDRQVYQCDVCEYNSVISGMMRRHMLLVHHNPVKSKEDVKSRTEQAKTPVECIFCYKFSCHEEKELDKHIEEVHNRKIQQGSATGFQQASPQAQQLPAVGQQGGKNTHPPQVQQQLPALGLQEGCQTSEAPPPAQQLLPVLGHGQGDVQVEKKQPQALGQQNTTQLNQVSEAQGTDTKVQQLENKVQRLELELTEAQCINKTLTAEVKKEKVEKVEAVKAVQKVIKEKQDIEVEYEKAVEVIRTQQRDVEEKAEKIKVLEDLQKVEQPKSQEKIVDEEGWTEIRDTRVEEVWDEENGQLVQALEVEERQRYLACKKSYRMTMP